MLGEGHFCGRIGGYLRWEKGIFVAGLLNTLGEGHFCGGIGGYVERRAFLWRVGGNVGRWAFLWQDWWLRWEKGILWHDRWLRWEKDIFGAALVATLGEGHFCGGFGGSVGRRAFLWRDWWLC
jgi:hypothetical protein